MDIILYGQQSGEDIAKSIAEVLQLFKDRYHVNSYREIHLNLSLLDEQGVEVELVDSETSKIYRIFEVYNTESELSTVRSFKPFLKLVIDNTHKTK